MRRWKVIPLLLMSISVMAGCGNSLNARTDTEYAAEEEAGMEEQITLTEQQEALLIAISSDEDRIREGKLYAWQVETVKQYEAAMAYLEEKYPSYSLEITDCVPKNKMNSYTTFWFKAEEQEEVYELYLETDEDGVYICKDNFYASFVGPEYEEALLELLREEVPECEALSAEMSAVKGEEFNEQINAESILEGVYRVSNTVLIFAVADDDGEAERIAEKAEQVVREKKIYGGYIVYVLAEIPDECQDAGELKSYVQDKGDEAYLLKKNFQQFD